MLGGRRGTAILFAVALAVGPASGPLAAAEDDPASAEIDYDRVKAIFEGSIPDDISVWAAQHGALVVLEDPRLSLVAFDVSSRSNASAFVEDLRQRSDVSFADYDVRLRSASAPDDPAWSDQYGPQLIDAPEAWTTEPGSKDVQLTVLDTGVDASHPDLRRACEDDCIADANGHGTAVAGVATAERDNGIGVAGMAEVDLASQPTLGASGSAPASAVASHLLDATEDGADIVSLGLAGECDVEGSNLCPELDAAVSTAAASGTLLVAPTGNDGHDHGVQEPASSDDVLAVGSVGPTTERSPFSNGGPAVDVVAPGEDVVTTAPRTSTLCGTTLDGLCTSSGTSLAAAHVAGVAALAASHCPAATSDAIASAITTQATDLGDAGPDAAHGHGLVDADDTLRAVC
jgi:subtilisin family serine protease